MVKPNNTRIRESPSGGSRIAWSYLVVVASAAAAGLVVAAAVPVIQASCSAELVYCDIGWIVVVFLVALLGGSGLGARLTGLGWEWLVALGGLVLLVPLALNLGTPVGVVTVLLVPALAGLATPPPMARWGRTALVVGAVFAALVLAAWLIL